MTQKTDPFIDALKQYGDVASQTLDLLGDRFMDLLNSDFGIAATGSFFGAVGGYVIVMVSNQRTEKLSRIGALKIAIAMCHSLFNSSFGLYRQHVKDLCKSYEEEKKKFIAIESGAIQASGIVPILYDFKSLSLPHVNLTLVNSKFFEKTDLAGRAFALATTLVSTIVGLNEMVHARHEMLQSINSRAREYGLNDHDKACLYFGTKLDHPALGRIQDQSYANVMTAINNFNEDCIWFSKELTQELIDLAKKTAKKIIFFRPRIGSVDYSDIDSKLLPKDEEYRDWREKFPKTRK